MSQLWQPTFPLKAVKQSVYTNYLENFLILTIDQRHARFFEFKNQHLKEKDDFFDPQPQPQDKEGRFNRSNVSFNTSGGSPEKHMPQRSQLKQYSHYIINKLKDYLKDKNKHLIILTSEKIHAIFLAETKNGLKNHITTVQCGEFVKEPLVKIEQRVKEIINSFAETH